MASETDRLQPSETGLRYGHKYVEQQVRGAEAAAGPALAFDPDDYFLISLTSFSVVTTILVLVVAAKSHTTAMYVEALNETVDLISYALNLWCSWWTKGKSMHLKERVEFRVALATTILLFGVAVRIGIESWHEYKCAEDIDFNEFNPSDAPCALSQDRPEPQTLIQIGVIMLCSYVPSLVILCACSGGISSYSPDENINKASALLHIIFDIVTQLSIVISGRLMMQSKLHAIEVDAWASFSIVVFLFIGSLAMWCRYATTLHWSDDEGPETKQA
jgi:Co/Zn/Cd efflux system component